jgi:hypothetical protein
LYMDSCDEPRHSVAVTDEDAWTFAIDDNTVPSIVEDLTEDVDNLMMSFHVVLKYDDIITYVDASKAILWFEGYPTSGGVTGAEIGTDPTTVIIHVTAPQDQTEYMLQLVEGFVWDDAINPNASLDTIMGPYYVGDRTAPELEGAGPTGIVDMPKGFTEGNVMVWVDFFDDSELTVVAPFTITDENDVVVATWTPVLDDEQSASFNPELGFGEYTVHIPAGSVVDTNGNEYEGFQWSFVIKDTTPPCLVSISPVDGATGVALNTPLVIEFCENMAAGDATKMLKVYEILEVSGGLGENKLIFSTPITEAMINGVFVTVNVPGLAYTTSYTVMVDAGAVTDEAGNDFAGITDPTVWNFTTVIEFVESTIAAIQGTGAESPVVGEKRAITGTVTGVVPGVGYYVQDANTPWSGIFVADNTTIVFEGNGVHVKGVVGEINGVTTLTGTATIINPPLAIVPIVLASPELAKEEQYESVNVTVKGVRAKAADANGLWDVFTEDTKVLTIGKLMYTYAPVAGNFYDVTGIANGANQQLEPRKLADVVNLTTTTDISVIDAIEFKVYPNPFNNELNIDNYDKLTRVTLTNIAGQRVIDVQYPERVIRTANLVSGVYVVTLFNENGIVKSERIVKR